MSLAIVENTQTQHFLRIFPKLIVKTPPQMVPGPAGDAPTAVTVSQDADRSKRGRVINSLSGWGHVIGVQTQKCLDFSTRIKRCATCSQCNRNMKTSHVTVSAKAMEPDIAVGLHKRARAKGLKYAAVIGDDDTRNLSNIRTSAIHKALTAKVRDSFLKKLTYAVKQNANKSEREMICALQTDVPHISRGGVDAGHINLPFGEPLKDTHLKISLENLLAPYIINADKVRTTGSSQANVSLNNAAWSKTPKSRNYNRGERFDYRLSVAVLQFNDGYSYINEIVHGNILMPQKHTEITQTAKMYKSSINAKRRRLEIKVETSAKAKSDEIKVGTPYESFCGFDSNMITKATVDQEKKNINIVLFDLKTTCLGKKAEIIQLAARSDVTSSSRYFLPDGDIDPKASNVISLTVKRDRNGNRYLCKNGQDMEAGNINDGIRDFLGWLSSLDKENIVLAVHNGKSFDNSILLKYLIKFKILPKFRELVYRFTDTLTILRKEKPGLKSYSLQNFMKLFPPIHSTHMMQKLTLWRLRKYYKN
ncbi:EXU-like protein [Mya arenaria]|uniref:EXU-like protein n=1 Tax=Mya arenaria TaxID=6604 RepID=A0ABY7EYA5_MYAAR|nr:EXU-like protein [Mya arenaria]